VVDNNVTFNEWSASLKLGFEAREDKTVLSHRQRFGPLAVQRPFYPEGEVCHVYLLHPPGGVAGGDQLDIQVNVQPNATALVTTPGATKFYHSAALSAQQRQRLDVESACLEWLPQENIFFPNAKVQLSMDVHLNQNAKFIGWEINCLGRPVIQENFAQGQAIFHFNLYKDGLPVLLERLPIFNDDTLDGAANLRKQPVFASFYATPANAETLAIARQAIPEQYQKQCAITCVDEVLIARYLGDSTEIARQLFVSVWQALRPSVLQRKACVPRIWQT